MNIFKQHIEYLRDNPKGYWFKRKLYGWGWTPANRKGRAVTALLIAYLLWISFSLPPKDISTTADLNRFFIKLTLGLMIFLFICYKTGESPKWQWGLPTPNLDKAPENKV